MKEGLAVSPLLPDTFRSPLPVPVQRIWPPASPRFLLDPPLPSDPTPNPQLIPLCPKAFA